MSKGRVNQKRYRYPLPIHPVDDLPELILHNPLSWLYWAYRYYKSTNALNDKVHVDFIGDTTLHITVQDDKQMLYLWNNGFFGTGQFSRSEPTWKARTEARLGLNDTPLHNRGGTKSNTETEMTLEKVTQQRRLQRLEFKKERAKLERELLELRKKGGHIDEENILLEKQRESLRKFKLKQTEDVGIVAQQQDISESNLRDEDNNLLDENGDLLPLESLELMPVEAMFLTFALPVLDISPACLAGKLFQFDAKYKDIHSFIRSYVIYHHYRSHGWCVRSGIKFGCDYLLYKRGPPFQHAEFCVMGLDHDVSKDYTWYSSIARVVGGAKKTFVLCYVERLISEQEAIALWKSNNFTKLFNSFQVGEVLYKRWVPGRNRD
ncbi:ASN_HP2_G0034600.mRNA.1.CDS.1 [Saccharomyces cerevisiae]|nr:BGP_1a_G0035780.mRNA.1.CDS.1 [Saccharomyces cerevisiae]CAI4613668.1 BGN_3a_G0035940.mRNA.1.CDS.1 [Saccharomyces cerevisiae]CAI5296226.1 ASN_HP2_G0034600.mRNA.1.CDS.1 [Saccharomyces cerevisiae]CAI5302926.1 BFH_HP2_G0035770.mRNA.1.CDS.1 [Saccharomyces cerevisiae]CAI6618221.1 ASN_HP2_G0034600.mRNA.1.CDS.1 [Saccharomyces cerevisiae]